MPASDLASRLDAQLADMKTKVRINGFRPGKVPVAHLKRVYGRSVMADRRSGDDHRGQQADRRRTTACGSRASRRSNCPSDKDAIEAALDARGDLAFTVALEVLPKFEVGEFTDIAFERPVAEVEDSEVEDGLEAARPRIAASIPTRPEGGKAESFDRVTVDFVGTIDGEPFEGGTSENIEVVIGSQHLHSRLRGAACSAWSPASGATVEATFPEAYAVAQARRPARRSST